ncbi:MAG: hypothetical protein RL038_561, partial [Actinomycetota bacterium]
MPISKRRKKDNSAPVETTTQVSREPINLDSPRWLAPTMVTFLVLGLLWVVVFYVAGNEISFMRNLGNLPNVG